MARWQPPIPAGALSSPTALQLERALALLARCYDDVDRHGWVKLSLIDLAAEWGIGYSTIKKWWRMLRTANIFSEFEDCGHRGVRARFRNEWLDWRIIRANAQGYDHSPEERNGYPQGSDRDLEQTVGVRVQGYDHSLEIESDPAQGSAQGSHEGYDRSPDNLHVGTHDLRSNNDDMRASDSVGAPSSHDQHPPSSSFVASLDSEPETQQTNALTETKPPPNREAVAPPTPVPPPPSSPQSVYKALWDALDTDEREWLQRAAPYDGERRRLTLLVERHGLDFVAEGIGATVRQSGRTVSYLERTCDGAAANGKRPSDPRSSPAAPPKRQPPPPNETDEERMRRVAEEIRASSGTISYHGGSPRGSITA